MLLNILDGAGLAQKVIVAGQESVVDRSGTIAATAVSQSFLAVNLLRSGFTLQNRGVNPMYLNELGAAAVIGSSFVVPANGFFPPEGFPVSTNAWAILGTISDAFTAREW